MASNLRTGILGLSLLALAACGTSNQAGSRLKSESHQGSSTTSETSNKSYFAIMEAGQSYCAYTIERTRGISNVIVDMRRLVTFESTEEALLMISDLECLSSRPKLYIPGAEYRSYSSTITPGHEYCESLLKRLSGIRNVSANFPVLNFEATAESVHWISDLECLTSIRENQQ